MTEAQKRVIEAVKAWGFSIEAGDRDEDQWRAENKIIKAIAALDREERASDVCPNCGRGICLCSVNETHVNTRGCDPLDADAEKAIFDSAALLKAAYEQKAGE